MGATMTLTESHDQAANMPLTQENSATAAYDTAGLDFWSQRYALEGEIWGTDASITAQLLAERLAEDSRIKRVLEVGFGYGRDLREFLEHGHNVEGIEVAAFGLSMAAKGLQKYLETNKAQLMWGDFTSASLGGDYDAISSHRVLHLLGNNGKVRAFVNKCFSVLKPDGLLYVSARNPDDYNPEQMFKIGDQAAYKDRPQQIISFWDKARFEESFGKKFEILDVVNGTEIESAKNPVDSHFSLMIAKRRIEPLGP